MSVMMLPASPWDLSNCPYSLHKRSTASQGMALSHTHFHFIVSTEKRVCCPWKKKASLYSPCFSESTLSACVFSRQSSAGNSLGCSASLNFSADTMQPSKLVVIRALCLESIFRDTFQYLTEFFVAAQMLLCFSLISYPKNIILYIGNGRYQSFLAQLFHISRGKATTQLYTLIN